MRYHRYGSIAITRGRPNRCNNYYNRNYRYGYNNQNYYNYNQTDLIEEFSYNRGRNNTTIYNFDRSGRIRNVIFNSSSSNSFRIRRNYGRRYLN